MTGWTIIDRCLAVETFIGMVGVEGLADTAGTVLTVKNDESEENSATTIKSSLLLILCTAIETRNCIKKGGYWFLSVHSIKE